MRDKRGAEPVETDVDEAIASVAVRLRTILDEHGPDALSFYVSGQLSLEAQYLANKQVKGFVRTNQIEDRVEPPAVRGLRRHRLQAVARRRRPPRLAALRPSPHLDGRGVSAPGLEPWSVTEPVGAAHHPQALSTHPLRCTGPRTAAQAGEWKFSSGLEGVWAGGDAFAG
ncbi:hypothetical protein Scel_88460 [Streptomyces cellostaticus]|nr:hypothetical protein Scel_88460 [Streptomyces cellostaticus]